MVIISIHLKKSNLREGHFKNGNLGNNGNLGKRLGIGIIEFKGITLV